MFRRCLSFVLAMGLLSLVSVGHAEDREFRLAAEPELHESGLLKYLLPRFSLKTGIKVDLTSVPETGWDTGETAALWDAAIVGQASGNGGNAATTLAQIVFHAAADDQAAGKTYAIVLSSGEANPQASVFVQWLMSEIGQRTVSAYQVDGQSLFRPGLAAVTQQSSAIPEGDADAGEALALLHCGRCHVVNEKNRMGGIGSTPSFAALRSIPGWEDKFLAFWSVNPHPSFTQIAGLTEPFDPDRPPHIAPLVITEEEMNAILAYAAKISPKDLGASIESR